MSIDRMTCYQTDCSMLASMLKCGSVELCTIIHFTAVCFIQMFVIYLPLNICVKNHSANQTTNMLIISLIFSCISKLADTFDYLTIYL